MANLLGHEIKKRCFVVCLMSSINLKYWKELISDFTLAKCDLKCPLLKGIPLVKDISKSVILKSCIDV